MTRTVVLCATALFVMASLHASDPMDNLIEQEKRAQEELKANDEDLPPAYFWGDKSAVEIVSGSALAEKSNVICDHLELDELIELSRGNPADLETELNTDLPRVGAMLGQSCLIHSNDTLVAIGKGWQKNVTVGSFLVRKSGALCQSDSANTLWMKLKESLADEPLFFSSAEVPTDIDNHYFELKELPLFDREAAIRKRLVKNVPDLTEFGVKSVALHGASATELFVLRRKTATLEDDQLPNEMLIWDDGVDPKTLWMERVDINKGSGHLRVDASLDFNQDGISDVIVSGDHNGCVYRKVFQGTKDGFSITLF